MTPSSIATPSSSAAVPEFDERHFRSALSQFATGVTVITTRDENGGFFGMTASSFNSVSLKPPLVLWSLSAQSRGARLFQGNSHYMINVLSSDQAHLAERFASRVEDRFEGVGFDLSHTGLPVLHGVAAWFECHNRSRHPEGDHLILVGEVERCAYEVKPGLVFHSSRFSRVADIET